MLRAILFAAICTVASVACCRSSSVVLESPAGSGTAPVAWVCHKPQASDYPRSPPAAGSGRRVGTGPGESPLAGRTRFTGCALRRSPQTHHTAGGQAHATEM
jgi:hypothetical protein